MMPPLAFGQRSLVAMLPAPDIQKQAAAFGIVVLIAELILNVPLGH